MIENDQMNGAISTSITLPNTKCDSCMNLVLSPGSSKQSSQSYRKGSTQGGLEDFPFVSLLGSNIQLQLLSKPFLRSLVEYLLS